MREKVTIQQIADMTGVSKFAVSRALSGKSGVSAQTRDMILRTAGQLGYFNNKTQKTRRTEGPVPEVPQIAGTIVVLFPNIRYQNKGSVYWGPIFEGVSRRLDQIGLDIITITEPSSDHIFSMLNPKAIKGIVTLGNISTQILLDIKRLGIPVVMVDHHDPAFHCDTIFTDNFTCMRELITRLISKGFRKLQYVGNIKAARSFMERWIAYRTVLEEHQLPSRQNKRLTEVESFVEISEAITALPEEDIPDVFVCANDFTAISTIEALSARGISVPGQCAVSGFDNTYPDSEIALTTVNVNKELLGMRAVDRILWRIANPDSNIEKTLICADIIMRESTAK
ncbi:LacI family DNA-binding transcriptional regulator [Paenibacillus tarimensis]